MNLLWLDMDDSQNFGSGIARARPNVGDVVRGQLAEAGSEQALFDREAHYAVTNSPLGHLFILVWLSRPTLIIALEPPAPLS